MKLKVYSQENCKYCENIKKTLEENKIEFEIVEIDNNREEWNQLTRIIGLGMTPTIKFGEEVWVPSRDFRGPEELITRLKYFQDYPPGPINDNEKTEILINGMKNIAMSLNNLGMQLSNIHQKINQIVPPPTLPDKQETNKPVVKETTN